MMDATSAPIAEVALSLPSSVPLLFPSLSTRPALPSQMWPFGKSATGNKRGRSARAEDQ